MIYTKKLHSSVSIVGKSQACTENNTVRDFEKRYFFFFTTGICFKKFTFIYVSSYLWTANCNLFFNMLKLDFRVDTYYT